MSRLLVYVHYNKYNVVSEYIYYQLKSIRSIYSDIVFVSNSHVSKDKVQYLQSERLIDFFIQRDNIGYDFAAWKEGLNQVTFYQYDSVTLMNDTCFGPLWDLEDYYSQFDNDVNVDFWGMTNHLEKKIDSVVVPEHLQSYFMVFKKRILQSQAFVGFWSSVSELTDIQDVIKLYESQLTKILLSEGYSYKCVLDTSICCKTLENRNVTLEYPEVILKNNVPFIKIKSFTEYPDRIYSLLHLVRMKTKYPVELIERHLRQIIIPGTSFIPQIRVSQTTETVLFSTSVLLHIHIESVSIFEEYIEELCKIADRCQLLITLPEADFSNKCIIVERYLFTYQLRGQIIKVTDELHFFETVKNYMGDAKYLAHITVKQTKELKYSVEDIIDRYQLRKMFFTSFDTVISNFESQSNLAVVIPDLTTNQRYDRKSLREDNPELIRQLNILYESLVRTKKVDFYKVPYIIGEEVSWYWIKTEHFNKIEEQSRNIDFSKEVSSLLVPILFIYSAWDLSNDYAVIENTENVSPILEKISFSSERELRLIIEEKEFLQIGLRRTLKIISVGIVSVFKMIKKTLLKN
ncbi:TPA: rhamnan synthesis protein F [Streptococcus suis]|nr:rhamnan synthesis protein F [Streptococcus suis]